MPAETHNFTGRHRCEQGATFSRSFIAASNLSDELKWAIQTKQISESQQAAIDAATWDLTGYTARMHVRPSAGSDSLVISLTTENGRITLGGTAGTIALSISASDTTSLTAGSYVYDLELVSGSTVTRLLQGKFDVDAEVTK